MFRHSVDRRPSSRAMREGKLSVSLNVRSFGGPRVCLRFSAVVKSLAWPTSGLVVPSAMTDVSVRATQDRV